MNNSGCVGEVGVHLEPVEITDDEQRRTLQCLTVLEELLIRSRQILSLALVLPREVTALPNVGEPVASADFLGALLEGVPLTARISRVRRGNAEHTAEVDEVLLRGRALSRDAA